MNFRHVEDNYMNFDFLTELTDSFTVADLTELCQRSTKAVFRESIEADEQRKALMKENNNGDKAMVEAIEDPVSVITRKHFEEALAVIDFLKVKPRKIHRDI